jgi:hypothetical protein
MNLHMEATDDLLGVLDRVLDKGIVVEPWARLTLHGLAMEATDSKLSVESSSIYSGYGEYGAWREERSGGKLFPYWRRELWSR